MRTHWILKTEGNPLRAVQKFLFEIWPYANLDGMLVQLYPADQNPPVPTLVEDPVQLLAANPFLPVVTVNAARLAAQVASDRPAARFAAVLRSCEAQAFFDITRPRSDDRARCLVIGVDCLGSFPGEDYVWRMQRAGGVDSLTSHELRSARQGGIGVDRYRRACQACSTLTVPDADIWIGLLGLPIRQVVLVTAANQALTERLHLREITTEPANPELLAQRDRVIARVSSRRTQSLLRFLNELPPELPVDVSGFREYLNACAPCRECLIVCPFCEGVVPEGDAELIHWLYSCERCGMCEEACPRHLPLTTMHTHIQHNLLSEVLAG